MAGRYPSIPEPTTDPNSLRDAALSTKEAIETMTRQRGDPLLSMVTWADLVALGLATAAQVPKKGA